MVRSLHPGATLHLDTEHSDLPAFTVAALGNSDDAGPRASDDVPVLANTRTPDPPDL